MIHASFTDLRKRLAHFMDRAVGERSPILVTRQGHEPVVLLARSDYETLTALLQGREAPGEGAEAFLKRMRSIGPSDDDMVEAVEAAIAGLRVPHEGVDL